MADEESKGFKVIDRRRVTPEDAEETAPKPTQQDAVSPGEAHPAQPAGASAAEASSRESEVHGPGWKMREEKQAALPPMDFTTFCLSLASSAMMHLGLVPNIETGAPEKNLPLAKQTIDILSLLQEKTKGNLTEAESKLLATVIYDLQIRFVEAKSSS